MIKTEPTKPHLPIAAYRFKENRGDGKFGYNYHLPEDYATAYRDNCIGIEPLCLVSDALAATAAAQAVQAVPGWQPIETAPKDGSWIAALGCYPDSGAPETVRWLEDEWGDGGNGYSLRDPTQWMALPPETAAAPQPPAKQALLTEAVIRDIGEKTEIGYVASGEGDYGSNLDSIVPFARAIEDVVQRSAKLKPVTEAQIDRFLRVMLLDPRTDTFDAKNWLTAGAALAEELHRDMTSTAVPEQASSAVAASKLIDDFGYEAGKSAIAILQGVGSRTPEGIIIKQGFNRAYAALEVAMVHAENYQWLREQQWDTSSLFVVCGPKENVRIGTYCPSLERLDDAIAKARLTNQKET